MSNAQCKVDYSFTFTSQHREWLNTYVTFGVQDIAEHLTTIHLSRCGRGKRCLYEGSTPPEGFPNNWVSYLFS